MTPEFWGAIGAITALLLVLIQVVRLTWGHRKIKSNDLGCMKKSIGKIEGTLTEFGADIGRLDAKLERHINDHLTGKIK